MENNESLQPDLFKQDEERNVTEVGGEKLEKKQNESLRDEGFEEFLKDSIQRNPPRIFPPARNLIRTVEKDWEDSHGRMVEKEDEEKEIIDTVVTKLAKQNGLHKIYDKLELRDTETRITEYYKRWEEYLKKVTKSWEELKTNPASVPPSTESTKTESISTLAEDTSTKEVKTGGKTTNISDERYKKGWLRDWEDANDK